MSLALIRSTPPVDLNPEQQVVVEHGSGESEGPGPLLVVAGAGSGKTAMLAHRVAALILAGADPKRIMLATFSRRAAAALGRPGAAGRAALGAPSGAGSGRRRDAGLFGHLPRHRRKTPARIRAAPQPRS